ncbi:AMP-dependent synthetase/ligase [Xylophilus sp. ASV27]|uniref:AMP-dependent synthetase/ligase n=1 Tax=Xylophilus sp. ASV27 TaxID=2795129 RepID=UPI0018EC2D72|nr:long-chain fatty acid--CoA ligase [Xylophilus sp. ASV27]
MALNQAPPTLHRFQEQETPARLFRLRCRQWAAQPALRPKRRGLWESVTWAEYYAHARAIGMQLDSSGLQRGAVVCVLAENRPEWLYVDMAAQCMGFAGNGIYPTSSADQVLHILQDSGAQAVFVQDQEQLEKVLAVRGRCPALRVIVVMERDGLRGFSDPQVSFFDDFLREGIRLGARDGSVFEAAIDRGRAEDLAFLVYTSGTTGAPKGAMILNRNVMFQLTQVKEYLDAGPGDKSLSFLPLCHIAERMASVFNPLAVGLVVHFPENPGTVLNDLREVAPQVLFAPPRFWEKMVSQIDLFMRDAIPLARWAYGTARGSAAAMVDARLQRQAPAAQAWATQWLRRAALRNVKVFLGLQNVRCALTGAAPVPADLIRWFLACGIELREAYGMTETSGFCAATPRGGIRLGWAGVKAPGTEIRLGADGEILIRGPNVFAGYWNLPRQTAETLDADGWLHTGDCGELDESGYLSIRDRIKDILITSGGKNITPSHIESLLKFSPYITDAVVIGDGRHYLTCLVMLDHEHVARHAQERQIPYTDYRSLARAPQIAALIRAEIERINPQLARVEQIKDFRIIDTLLTAEDEELTPTMKLKRKVIARKYALLIDDMYGGARQAPAPA